MCSGIESFVLQNKSVNCGRGVKGKSFSAAPSAPSPNFSLTPSPEIKPAHLENSLSKSAWSPTGEAGCPGAAAGLPAPTLTAARGAAAEGHGGGLAAGALEAQKHCSSPSIPAALPRALGLNQTDGEKKDGLVWET